MFTPDRIARARPLAITDRVLAQLTRIAHDAPQGNASEAEAEWLLSCAGPLLVELAARRAVMSGTTPALDLTNVIVLPGGAA